MLAANRTVPGEPWVALETTLLAHGVPRGGGLPLARELAEVVSRRGARAAVVGVLGGEAIVGMGERELATLLADGDVPKVNTANLGIVLHRGQDGATTVSATVELAAAAGVRVFATGGLGGVHQGYGTHLDISSDLAALARFPVAVVASGVKSLLDVQSTREALETLGVPVVGFRTDRFPAFYLRESAAGVDARFDEPADLARFAEAELARTGRGVLIANPVPADAEIDERRWNRWLAEASREAVASGASGRDVTPAVLSALHRISGGATLGANVALVKANAELAAALAVAMRRQA
jgi:pseudouridylate synthase